jgi:hypothetical protein
MGRTACTEPQCLHKGALYLNLPWMQRCVIWDVITKLSRKVEASLKCDGTAQKPDFIFLRNVRVHLNRRGRHFSRLLTAEVCVSADKSCSEVVWRVLDTHSIRQFPLHFPSRASPCAITFQLKSTAPIFNFETLVPVYNIRVFFGTIAPSGPGPPHSRGF